jgi:hypothetical protein
MAIPLQDNTVGWQLNADIPEPGLAFNVYVLFALLSFVVSVALLLRNWIALPPFKRALPEKSGCLRDRFQRQATSLRRWMAPNSLAWLAITAVEFSHGLNSLSTFRTIRTEEIAYVVSDLIHPLQIFLWIMIVLYVARWHILWRCERIEPDL